MNNLDTDQTVVIAADNSPSFKASSNQLQDLKYRDKVSSTAKAAVEEEIDWEQGRIGEVCRNVVSKTFRYYFQEDMTF